MIKSWREMNAVAQNVAVFPSARQINRDWGTQELAEFYRVENALVQSGMRIVTDRGISDEGDPWFIFCREADGEPIVHFARADGYYIIASPAYEGITRGQDLRSMVKEMIERHKLSLTESNKNKANIQIHPAALLIVLVGAAFFKMPGNAHADELKKDVAHGQKNEVSAPALLRSYGLSHWLSTLDTEQANSEDVILRNLWLIASTVVTGSHEEIFQVPENGKMAPGNIFDRDAGIHSYLQKNSDTHSDQSALKESSPSAADTHYQTVAHWIEQKDNVFVGSTKVTHDLHSENILATMREPLQTLTGSQQATTPFVALDTHVFREILGNPTKLVGDLNNSETYVGITVKHVTTDKGIQPKLSEPASSANGFDVALADPTANQPKNAASYGVVPQPPAIAASFLNDNKIFLELKTGKSNEADPSIGVEKASPPKTVDTKFDTVEEIQVASSNVTKQDVSIIFKDSYHQEPLSSEIFLKTLSAFIQKGQDVYMTVSDGSYVFAESTSETISDSITATFSDGSAISIVGQYQLLHDLISVAV